MFGVLFFLERIIGGKAMTATGAAISVSQGMEKTMKMTGCRAAGCIPEQVPERCFICMKCYLGQLMEEKSQGLELQVKSYG